MAGWYDKKSAAKGNSDSKRNSLGHMGYLTLVDHGYERFREIEYQGT